MKVEVLMTQSTQHCSPRQSLADAARLMWDQDCGSLPVVESDRRVVGMITDRDICMSAYFKGVPLHEISVESTMSARLVSCRSDDTIETAEAMMANAQVRRLPVTDEAGCLLGILSLNDLALEAARGRASKTHEIELTDVALTLSAVCRRPFPTVVVGV